MGEFKGILESKGVWGGVIALLAGLAGLYGYSVDAALQGELVGVIIAVVTAIGGALGIYGRITATKQIGTAPE